MEEERSPYKNKSQPNVTKQQPKRNKSHIIKET